jgi:predicted NUDIX family phosphoesterase
MTDIKQEEHVLVVPRSLLDSLGPFQGVHSEPAKYLPSLLDPANNFFLPRSAAEEDPSHKQIIPYAVFHCEGRILHYVRGGGGGEKRLAHKGSIGIGGHINQSDFHHAPALEARTYHNGVTREIHEELVLPEDDDSPHRVVGLINDDSSPVGQVHLGVVHLVDLKHREVSARESDITRLEFLSLAELEQRRDRLESWSLLCLDALPGWLGLT